MTNTQHRAVLQRQSWQIANDYNLSVSGYGEAKDTREVIDITTLNAELKITVARTDQLLKDMDTNVAEIKT